MYEIWPLAEMKLYFIQIYWIVCIWCISFISTTLKNVTISRFQRNKASVSKVTVSSTQAFIRKTEIFWKMFRYKLSENASYSNNQFITIQMHITKCCWLHLLTEISTHTLHDKLLARIFHKHKNVIRCRHSKRFHKLRNVSKGNQ